MTPSRLVIDFREKSSKTYNALTKTRFSAVKGFLQVFVSERLINEMRRTLENKPILGFRDIFLLFFSKEVRAFLTLPSSVMFTEYVIKIHTSYK